MKTTIHSAAVAIVFAAGLTSGATLSVAQTPDAATPPGQAASPDVAHNRHAMTHSRNHKPRHHTGAPKQAASPSVADQQKADTPPTGSTSPDKPAEAPAQGAAPSVKNGR